MAAVDLDELRARLQRLGVDMAAAAGALDLRQHTTTTVPARPLTNSDPSSKKEVAELLARINHVESGLKTADHLAQAAAARINAQLAKGSHGSPEARTKSPVRARKVPPKSKALALTTAALIAGPHAVPSSSVLRAPTATGPPRGAVCPHTDLMRGVPSNAPLATVLHQFKEAEVAWAHEKAQLRREAVEQRRRANKADADVKRLTRMLEHKNLDLKSLKSALQNRDTQLDAAIDRIKDLEGLLLRTQEDNAIRVATVSAERDDCKALLIATLQRLEAVDEVVHRADVSSTMMQEKMKALEEERLRALEAAARARAEVADLTESRRKLQWQSKLLEKMSEVQLRHNKRKSDALKKLLSPDQRAGATSGALVAGLDADSLAASDLDPTLLAEQTAAYHDLLEDHESADMSGLQEMMQQRGGS